MDQTGQNDLFEIRVTPSGKYYIRRFAIIARIIIIISILISFIHIATAVVALIIFKPSQYASYKYLLLGTRLLPYYTVVFCIVLYLQMYSYWQVTKYLRKGLELNDEDRFNKAFESLYKYSLFGIVLALLSFLSYGFELFTYIIYYL